MYGTIKRSIAKFILVMGMAAVISGLLGLTTVPASASAENVSAKDTTSVIDNTEVQAKDTTPATVSGDVEDVLTSNASFIGKSKKVKACKAYAEKRERRSPPRDPQAGCWGKLKVKLFGKIVASCPTGYLGAKMTLGVSLREMVRARAFAKSVASGRVRTWARFKIRDLAKIKGKTHIECVLIPVVTPPPPPPPPPTCESHPDMPECITPPPPVVPKPVLLDVTQVNDLEVNWQTPICAEYNVAQGRSALLKFAPFFGSIVDGPSSFTVTGHDTKCVTLKAPSEVPAGDTQAGIPAGKDRVTYTLTDTVSGESAAPMSSDYRVYEPAGHPDRTQQ